MNGNNLVEIRNTSALGVKVYIQDKTRPSLDKFDIDINAGILSLFFSETVNTSALDFTQISFLGGNDSSYDSYALTGGNVVTHRGGVVTVLLSKDDLDVLKSREDIATSFVDTFISVTNETIRDMDGNFVRGVGPSQPLPVNYYGEDITSPVLVSFTLDMDDGNLRMTFSETVDVSSLEISEVSIHNNRTGSSVTYNLTKLSNFTSADSPIVTLPLSIFDVNELKRLTNLAVQADGSDAFLSLTPSFVSDMNQNRITPIRPSDAKQAFEVTPDTTCPALSSFTLDMNTGYLTLYFDETVNSTSMDVSEIALLSSASREETYSLTTSSVESPDGPVIVILLSSYDADRIKIRRKLATSREDTWIHLTVSSLTDMAGNSYCNVSKVLQTSFHEADRERPILLSYSLDVNAGVLLFTFSEAFQLTDTTSITLLSFPSEQGSVNFTLTGGYVSVAQNQHW